MYGASTHTSKWHGNSLQCPWRTPRGQRFCRCGQVFGPESSGKTTLAMHAIAEVQRQGGTAALIDAEHAFDPVYSGVRLDLAMPHPDPCLVVSLRLLVDVARRLGSRTASVWDPVVNPHCGPWRQHLHWHDVSLRHWKHVPSTYPHAKQRHSERRRSWMSTGLLSVSSVRAWTCPTSSCASRTAVRWRWRCARDDNPYPDIKSNACH
jgi:hypothetical protein